MTDGTRTLLRFEREELMPTQVSDLGDDTFTRRGPWQLDWAWQGACRTGTLHPDAWFPASRDPEDSAEARQVCLTRCPVRDECLNAALRSLAIDGIWGGTDRDERRAMMRRRRR